MRPVYTFNKPKNAKDMKPRILTTLIALLAIVMGVQAENYGVWIGGVQITSDNYTNITNSDNGGMFDAITAGEVTFDPSTMTLTLNGATIRVTYSGTEQVVRFSNSGTLMLFGNNTINSTNDALQVYADLTVMGPGSLQCTSVSSGIYVNNASLSIYDCTLNASGQWGITGNSDEALTIKYSTVRATGSTGSICDLGSMSMTGCSISSPSPAGFTDHAVRDGSGNTITTEVVITAASGSSILPVAIAGTDIKASNFISQDGNTILKPSVFPAIKSGSISYLRAAKTLVLNGVTVETTGWRNAISVSDNVNIMLFGDSHVTLSESDKVYCALSAKDNVSISGPGSATFISDGVGINISSYKTLTITNTNVNAQGEIGIAGEVGSGSLVINRATVRSTGTDYSIGDLGSFSLSGCDFIYPADASFVTSRHAVCVGSTPVTGAVLISPVTYIPIDETTFPNTSFRNYISSTNANIDKNGDSLLSPSEIASVTWMNVANKGISDLTGIQYFTAMTSLYCHNNSLTTLDVSACVALHSLQCNNNQLASLVVSPSMNSIQCYNNRLGYSAMQQLVESLPSVSGGILQVVNTNSSSSEQNIITSAQVAIATAKGWSVQTSNSQPYAGSGIPINNTTFPDQAFKSFVSTNFDSDHDGSLSEAEIAAVTSITFTNSSSTSLEGIGFFTALTSLDCSGNRQLTELNLSQNTALLSVDCHNCNLSTLNVKACSQLTHLYCNGNRLAELILLTYNPALQVLHCYENQLSSLSLYQKANLQELDCHSNRLTSLDVLNCPQLQHLDCSFNLLARELDFVTSENLQYLAIHKNRFSQTAMDNMVYYLATRSQDSPGTFIAIYTGAGESNVYTGTNVFDANQKGWKVYSTDGTESTEISSGYLYITAENFPDDTFRNYILSTYDPSGLGILSPDEVKAVKLIRVSNTSVADLTGIEYFTELKTLYCNSCQITSLDLSKNPNLEGVDCLNNPQLTGINITGLTKLTNISFYLCGFSAETVNELLSALPDATTTAKAYITSTRYDETNSIDITAEQLAALHARNWHLFIYTGTSNVELTTGAVTIAYAFPDENFRSYVTSNCDTESTHKGLLTDTEVQAVISLFLNEKGISDLTGIERFTNLQTLWCQDNQLTMLDVSNNAKLTTLNCQNNQLQMLDVTGTDLYDLRCYGNQIKGELMQLLINSLPDGRTVRRGYLTAYNTAGDEGNDMPTSAQISTANSLGWYVFSSDGSNTTQLKPLQSVQINSMNFPDANFRSYVSQKCDKDGDGILSAEELEAVTEIYVPQRYIEDLKGIEYFTALEIFNCTNNEITTLDISKNTKLRVLRCGGNQLTALDVTNNEQLDYLDCGINELTSLDVSKNTALTVLDFSVNNLFTIDLSHNPALERVSCGNNQLTELDFSHNPVVSKIDCSQNTIRDEKMEKLIQSLPTVTNGKITLFLNSFYTENDITIALIHEAMTKGWRVSKFPYNILRTPSESVEINATYFPDANFRSFVRQNYDADKNGILTNDEVIDIDEMDVSGLNIADLTGLGFFWNLKTLDCHNNQLTSLDLSYFNYLTNVKCYQNRIQGDNMEAFVNDLLIPVELQEGGSNTIIIRSTLSGEQNDALTDKQIITATGKTWNVYTYDGNSYATVEASEIAINSTNFPDDNFRQFISSHCDEDGNGSLSYQEIQEVTCLYADQEEIGSLKGVEFFTELTSLSFDMNYLTELDVSHNLKLEILNCGENNLTSLDLSQNTALKNLYCYCNALTSIDVSKNTELEIFSCWDNQLNELDLSKNTALKALSCDSNHQLSELDLSKNILLEIVECGYNKLSTLDLSKNLLLKELDCPRNQLTTLDLSKNKLLTKLECYANNIKGNGMQMLVESLPSVTNGTLIPVYNDDSNEHNHMTTEQAALATAKGWKVKALFSEDFEELFNIDVAIFPDENFRKYVSDNFDTDHNGKLSRLEADAVEVINVADMNINDLTGIACFSQLKELYCNNNNNSNPRSTDNNIVTLDLSGNTELTRLACGQNWTLESLNITNCTKLENLHCANNNLSSLDVTHNPKLWRLQCWNNQLTALNLSNNPLLKAFNCSQNQLTSLDVSNHTALDDLDFFANPLTSLDVSGCTALWNLYIGDVPLTTVDLSNNPTLRCLSIYNTQLSSIDLSHNTALTQLSVANNSRLGGINLQYNTALDTLSFYDNEVMTFPNLSHNTALTFIWYNNNKRDRAIILPNLPLLKLAQFANSQLTKLDVSACSALENLYCPNNQLTSLDVSGCLALVSLYCSNNQLTSLDVSALTNLKRLSCNSNQLSSLDMSGCPALTNLSCGFNQLPTLDLSHNTALTYLNIYVNPMTSIDLSANTALESLFCGDQLTALDLSHNTELRNLDCAISQISSLVVTPEAANLANIGCYDSQLRGGKAIDDLIESLSDRTSADDRGFIWFRNTEFEEHNYCSYDQVMAAQNKGWIFAECRDGSWYYYWGTTSITGDVNADNQVTIADVTALVNIILGKTTDFDISVADVNGDSQVTIADVTALVNIILGKTTSPSKVKAQRAADTDAQGVQSAVETVSPENAVIRAPRIRKATPKEKILEGIADDLMPRIKQKQVAK